MNVKLMIFLPLTILAILVFLVMLIIMAVDDIKAYRFSKKREKELEKRSELEEFAKLCATKHVRLHYLGLSLTLYNEKVMCDAREYGYYRLPLTKSEYDLARKVMNEYGKNKDIVWIDIHGNKFYDFSQIEDRYLKNIAFGLANRKGNVKFLYNNKKAIDNIFAECNKRNIFYNNYDEKLKSDAYEIWLEKDEIFNKIFGNTVNEAIKSAKEELGIDYD